MMTLLSLGSPLPAVEVTQKGEVLLDDGKTTYGPWHSSQLTGKVRTVLHLAGRSSAKEMNEPLVNALKAAHLPQDFYQTTTIVNTDDTLFGTSAIVAMMVEGGKKEFPWSSVVVDARGIVRKTWDLQKESSAVAVLNPLGELLFFREGALSASDVQRVLQIIELELARAGAIA